MPLLHAQQFWKFLLVIFLPLSISIQSSPFNYSPDRSKRSLPLLFTNTSAITFICGFGIPVNDLDPELVTVGMVFKSPQILPTTVSSLKQQASHSVNSRSVVQYENIQYKNISDTDTKTVRKTANALSKYRVFFYKALEQLSASLRQAGRTCVLKMICQVSTVSFHYKNGILAELIYILFTPSSSVDAYATQDYDYVRAEKLGKNGVSCEESFRDCNLSILERVTSEFD